MKRLNKLLPVLIVLFVGAFFRFWHLNFGLPHSFYADEPELMEPAIKYTYSIRNIVSDKNWHELIPISYVYGTFPTYFLTSAVMVFSKTLNVLNVSFDKTTLFLFQRSIFAFLGVLLILTCGNLYKSLNQSTLGYYLMLLLIALNWKFIVHSHYANHDILITLLIIASFIFAHLYNTSGKTKDLLWMSLFLGLSVGTKITTIIALPLYIFLIFKKKDIWGIPGLIFVILLTFMITNPFSIIFFNDFIERIFTMGVKEAGMVFDSVDYSPFKYISALSQMLTAPIFLLGLVGMVKNLKKTANKDFDIFMIMHVVLYLVFFSLQTRRVDRWLLPLLPIFIYYAADLLQFIYFKFEHKTYVKILFGLLFLYYVHNPILLLAQFQRYTPKAQSFLWAQKTLPPESFKLVYTEEGLDPLNKLKNAKVVQYPVYTSSNAHLYFPEDPTKYSYVFVSSRPMENFKRKEVIENYPNYTKAWNDFENTLQDATKFEVTKDFVLPKPNLIPLSDVAVYKRVNNP